MFPSSIHKLQRQSPMTAFSARIRIFAFFCFFCAMAPLHGMALNGDDERASGRTMHAAPSDSNENHPSAKETKHKTPVKHEDPVKHEAPAKRAGDIRGDLNRIESFGLLTTPKQGGLGIDMWDGSDRAAVTDLI